jgi:hypothetical protein
MKEYYTDNNIDSIINKLNEYGIAIIPQLLSDKEIQDMNDGMWSYLEYITEDFDKPIKRNNTNSWDSYFDLQPLYSMIIQHWGIGHAQHVWDLRENPKIVDIFAKIWDCNNEDLLTSFDISSFHLPPEITKRGFFENKYWFHSDQSYTKPDFECVQSWVTGYDVNEGDATLVILEKSHKLHNEFAQKFNIDKKEDWYLLNEEEIKFYKDNCEIKKITCPAGSMVLWDSRLIHCGMEPEKTRVIPNFRNVSYICMMPRKLVSEDILIKKQKAFKNLRTTTHWPNRVKVFTKYPKLENMPKVKEISQPILSELGKKLAGF